MRRAVSSLTSLRMLVPILLILLVISLFLRALQITGAGEGSRPAEKRENKIPMIPALVVVLLVIYMMFYLNLTLLYRHRTAEAQINLTPFWSYREAFRLNPPWVVNPDLAREILLNILLTVPLGLLLPVLFHGRKHPFLITAGITLGLSVLTEGLQYWLHLGLCETDDIFNNMLGCLIGMGILSIGTKMMRKCRLSRKV